MLLRLPGAPAPHKLAPARRTPTTELFEPGRFRGARSTAQLPRAVMFALEKVSKALVHPSTA